MSEIETQLPEPSPVDGAPQPHEPAAVEEPAKLGPLSRLTGTLLSPGETFVDVNRKPTWLAPLIIVMLTGFAVTLAVEQRVKPDWDRFFRTQATKAIEKSGRSVPQEQLDQQIAMQVKFTRTDPSSPLSIALLVFKMVIYAAFYCVVPAGVFALGLMLLQSKTTFKKVLSVVAWSSAATGLIGAIVFIAALMIHKPEELQQMNPTTVSNIVPSNLAVILPPETSPFIWSLISSIDVFSIWLIVLLIIGFVTVSGARRVTKGSVVGLVVSLFVVWAFIKGAFAALFLFR